MGPLAGRQFNIAAAAVSALIGVAVGWALAEPYQIAASAFLAGTMGAIAFEDWRRLRVPDAWNLLAALGGFVVVLLDAWSWGGDLLAALGWPAISMILCGGAFYLLREVFFRLRGIEGLGFGDVKLAATGGIWLGWELFPVAVMIAAVGAIVWIVVAVALRRGWPRERKIPFAAFLAPAIWFCWVYARMAQI